MPRNSSSFKPFADITYKIVFSQSKEIIDTELTGIKQLVSCTCGYICWVE